LGNSNILKSSFQSLKPEVIIKNQLDAILEDEQFESALFSIPFSAWPVLMSDLAIRLSERKTQKGHIYKARNSRLYIPKWETAKTLL
jgi:hypothetical protein